MGIPINAPWEKGITALPSWIGISGKSLGLTASREIDDLLFSPELVDFVVEGWEKLLPMYRFLREIHVEE